MKHFLGLIFLMVLASSCSKTEENKATHTMKSIDPQKSQYYKAVTIHPIIAMEKDTFHLGDTLKAKAWFNEEVSMLKNIAEKEGWGYSIDFQKSRHHGGIRYFNPDKGDTGMISFVVQDTTLAPGEVKKQTFSLISSFGYWDKESEDRSIVYDTSFFTANVPYYIAH